MTYSEAVECDEWRRGIGLDGHLHIFKVLLERGYIPNDEDWAVAWGPQRDNRRVWLTAESFRRAHA